MASPNTICIDARLYGISHTGIGRYVMNLIRYLPADKRIKVVLVVSTPDFSAPELAGFEKHIARFHPYHPLSQLEMLWLWARIRPGLLHVPHFSIPVFWPGKLVVTIHDLIKNYSRGKDTTTHSPFIYNLKYLGYRLVLSAAIRRADKILVPAEYWRKILIRDFSVSANRVVTTYEGVDDRISAAAESGRFTFPKPLLVYTGNLYPHKNVPVLLQAVKQLSGRVKLAIVCARSVFSRRLEKMVGSFGLEKDVYFLGRLPDDRLAALYLYADLFVFPSLIEGFGLPGLEAMSVGLPVIAARASCLPEIYHDAAVYFDPRDPADLKQKIEQLLSDPKLRSELIARGRKLVKSYSWQKMAKKTWNEYQNVLR